MLSSASHTLPLSMGRRFTQALRRLANIRLLLAVFSGLGVVYALATPIFEKPDEMAHFAYIKALADGRGFPSAPISVADSAPAQESSQPPLYYGMAAFAVRLIAPDTGDFAALINRNPAFPYPDDGVPNDNKNVLIHAVPEVFPYQGAARALIVARLVALLFGALTAWATYHFGLEIYPDRRAAGLLAAAIVAFTPQFLFISSAASNDSAAAAMCALSLWATASVMRHGFTARRAGLLGLVLGLTALSKASAAALIPIALLAALVVDTSGRTRLAIRIRWTLYTLAIAIFIAGPWYLHTAMTFGDLLGISTHLSMPWARAVPLSFDQTLIQLPGAATSFWLAFGWGNILAPDCVYNVLNALAAGGLIGAALRLGVLWRQRSRSTAVPTSILERAALPVSCAWIVVMVIALMRWVQLLSAPLGRLLFPAIAAFAVLLAVGWLQVLRRAWLVAMMPLALGLLSAAAVPMLLIPAYARPAILTPETIQQQPGRAIDIRYGDIARLIRINAPRDHWPQPGQGFYIDLCWEPLARDDRRLMVLVQLIGENNQLISSRRTVPGLGLYPTGMWQPGGRFCDKVHVQLPDNVRAPAIYQVEVGFIDEVADQRLPAFGPDGTQLTTNFVAAIKVAPTAYSTPPIEHPVNYRLGDQIELIGYDLQPSQVQPGQSARLRLYWRTVKPPELNYTVFVHVPLRAAEFLAQADSPPQAGAYPTTFWDAGEVVSDEHVIAIGAAAQAGQYPIVVGLYNAIDGTRLALAGNPAQTEIQLPGGIIVK